MAQSGSDSFSSTLADGSDSLRSALEGGHDYMLENLCDLPCGHDGLEKEAVGFCVDCQDYLCTECFRNHRKPTPSRYHVLLDQHQMPSREAKKTPVHHVMDIEVRSRDDKAIPSIKGCVILHGDKLVMIDDRNNSIKLIDMPQNTIVSQLRPGRMLSSITQVNNTQVAVTSYNTPTIYVVNIKDNELTLDHKIQVIGRCVGIASINDDLVVSYDKPVKVEIINMEGILLQTVITEDKGRELFKWPWHVAVSKDTQTIYIADAEKDTVTSVDLKGQVQATFKDTKLLRPCELTLDSAGSVYVCGRYSNNVLQLTADLTKIQELLQESDGVDSPWSVHYCDDTNRLFVGMMQSDVVKVYQLE